MYTTIIEKEAFFFCERLWIQVQSQKVAVYHNIELENKLFD